MIQLKIHHTPSSYVLGRLRALASKKIQGPILTTSDSKHGSPGLRALRHLPEDVGEGSFSHSNSMTGLDKTSSYGGQA